MTQRQKMLHLCNTVPIAQLQKIQLPTFNFRQKGCDSARRRRMGRKEGGKLGMERKAEKGEHVKRASMLGLYKAGLRTIVP